MDDELLKELGWSEAELKRFVERWQQRKAAAEQNDASGDAAKRELDDALRSLGLQRGKLQQNAVQKDYAARSARGLSRPGAAGISRSGCGPTIRASRVPGREDE